MQLSSLYIYLRVKCYWLNRDWKRRSGTYVGTLAHRPPGARLIKLHINPHISVKKEPSGNIQTHCRGFCSWTSIMKASLKSKGGRGMEKHSRILPGWPFWLILLRLHKSTSLLGHKYVLSSYSVVVQCRCTPPPHTNTKFSHVWQEMWTLLNTLTTQTEVTVNSMKMHCG